MKRQILSLVLLLTAAALLPGQSIVVTSPREGETFRFGQICAIAWTKSGALPDTVSIRLRRAGSPGSEPAVLEIAGGTANDGSFSWAIPASLAAGSYFVRVKAPGAASGDSKAFSGAAAGLAAQNVPGSPAQPKGLPPGASSLPPMKDPRIIDFQMVDVERETGSGALYARLRNNGSSAFDGPLTFTVFFDSRQLDPITLPVEIAAGAEKRVNLMYYLSPLDMALRERVQVLVSADGDSKVAETDERNNAASRVIQKTCPIYIKDFRIEVTPSSSTGSYPLPVKLTIHLDVIGQGELELKFHDTNWATFVRKFQISGPGTHTFQEDLVPIWAEWVAQPNANSNCPKEKAWCVNVRARKNMVHADGGVQESNSVSCRYEGPK